MSDDTIGGASGAAFKASGAPPARPEDVKRCCADLYGSDITRWLLGESFHPGGLALTREIAQQLQLRPGSRLLDVACGRGTSALHIAENFRCEVVGADLSGANVRAAHDEAMRRGLSPLARFVVTDAEALDFPDAGFDAILCECAFCTFPDKPAAARELNRVLRPGGLLGLSDLTRVDEPLPEELNGLLAWVSCIADAQPAERYATWLRCAGFTDIDMRDRSACLMELVQQVRAKLGIFEIMTALKKLAVPGLDLGRAKGLARAAVAAVEKGQLGYATIVVRKAAIAQDRA
ncbi:MAG: class I SAM-dependent methyltransferase [Steroidobacteraceae bacterium]